MSFRSVPGAAQIEVSRTGRVRDARTGRPRRIDRSDSGYARVRILEGGVRRSVLVHRAVLLAHVGPPPDPAWHAAHGPRGRAVNAVGNLSWKPPLENQRDKIRDGTTTGGRAGVRVPTIVEVLGIRSMAARGVSRSQIAKRFEMHRSSVARIIDGKRWPVLP